ncbi:MAG: glycosyltransferase [Ignavibacteria bacterium]|nr:glycosyltransferase [Ignavibacteria bacterium]
MTPLLFIKHKNFNARTVDNDILILSKEYKVRMYEVNTSKGFGFFLALIKEFFWLLVNIHRYKVLFIWFADYHSFFPVFFSKLFNKTCVINIGGYDADEILTGNPSTLKEKLRKFCVKYSVKNASALLPVSNVIKGYLESASGNRNIRTMYCCIDTTKFIPAVIPVKENIVVTVGGGGEFIKEAKRKRLDYFIALGEEFNKRNPEYNARFFAIGHNPGNPVHNFLSELVVSEKVVLIPSTKSIEELVQYFSSASVYMQLSYYEAFGIAQVEAMLYGCIPVSNPGGAIAEVIGDAGFTVKDYDTDGYIRILKEIFDHKHEGLRAKAQKRAINNFSLEARENKLLPFLRNLL